MLDRENVSLDGMFGEGGGDKGFLKVKAMKQKIILLPEFPCASALCQAAKESLEIKANPCPHRTENLIN